MNHRCANIYQIIRFILNHLYDYTYIHIYILYTPPNFIHFTLYADLSLVTTIPPMHSVLADVLISVTNNSEQGRGLYFYANWQLKIDLVLCSCARNSYMRFIQFVKNMLCSIIYFNNNACVSKIIWFVNTTYVQPQLCTVLHIL